MSKCTPDRGACSPPVFLEAAGLRDRNTIKAQMRGRKFDSSIIRGISRRCKWGYPQVFVCNPLKKSSPFPTVFWLSCPYLVKACSRVESSGGVAELESSMRDSFREWKKYNLVASVFRMELMSACEKRFLQIYRPAIFRAIQRTMIGGISSVSKPTMKCIHLQVAAWLSLKGHPGEGWLKDEFPQLSCSSPCCQVCGGS